MSGVAIYLVIGVPASGKSWVCEQLTAQFEYVRHDDFKDTNKYLEAIRVAHKYVHKPLLIETPFSVSQIKEPLETRGYHVVPVFIIEDDKTLDQRYRAREKKPIPVGHLSRQRTYRERAAEWHSFVGTSSNVLNYLSGIAGGPPFIKDRLPWE